MSKKRRLGDERSGDAAQAQGGELLLCHPGNSPASKMRFLDPLPSLVVLDLDKTVVRPFPGVVELLHSMNQQGSIRLAVASRSPEESPAGRELLRTLGLLEIFCSLQIYRGSKTVHFEALQALTGLPYRKMLFFDDERVNIRAVTNLGVCCVLVSKQTGLSTEVIQAGFKKYREAVRSQSSLRSWLRPCTQEDGAQAGNFP